MIVLIDIKGIMNFAQSAATDYIADNAKENRYPSNDPMLKDKMNRDYIEAFASNLLIRYHEKLSVELSKNGINI